MRATLYAAAVAALSLGFAGALLADESSPSMPSGVVGATFNYATTVKSPKGDKSGSGRITVKSAGEGKLAMTITTSDGTSKTIPLAISNGSVTPAMPSPASSMPPAAQSMLANMKLAATVGVAAKKSGGQNFNVPVNVAPIGIGDPVSANLSMAAKATGDTVTYSGTTGGATKTVLPSSSGLDPEQLAKTAGAGVAAGTISPRARAAAAIAVHHREEEAKKNGGYSVYDAVSVAITSTFQDGRFHEISGTQTDALAIGPKTIKIVTTWSFTRVP